MSRNGNMTAIVYEGVGGRGDLFEGIKFCFLQRVPMRSTWIEKVESNGGEIVKLEKQADIVIADHARKKDCPAGSISWTYVEESIKNGERADLEEHRAGPVSYIAREVGSGGPTRVGRTPYTAEDDRILMDWVVKGERAGISTKGNELFRQLEEANNRHPFQSWRDRWIKFVQFRPRPSGLNESEASNGPAQTNINNANTSTTRSAMHRGRIASSSESPELVRHTPTSTLPLVPAKPSTEPVSSMKSNETKVPKSPQANPWIAKSSGGMRFTEEEINLLMNEYDAIMDIDEDQAIDAWAAWAVMYPTHTPQEWRNYFVKQLTRIVERGRRKKLVRKDEPSNQSRSSRKTTNQPAPDIPVIKIEDSEPPVEGNSDPALTDENVFKQDLTILAQGFGIEEVEFSPVICGKIVPLFKLWKVVKKDFGGNDEVTGRRLWSRVARKLNFNAYMHTKAAEDLEACYGEILADFETARDQYIDPTESQEQALIEQQLFASALDQVGGVQDEVSGGEMEDDEEDFDDDLNAPQASPALKISSKRRSSEPANEDLSSVAGSFSKRQRINKGKGKELEIPSTPEESINVTQNSRKSPGPSPLKPYDKPRRCNAEPETQDFLFTRPEDEEEENESRTIDAHAPSSARNTAEGRPTAAVMEIDSDEESSTQSQTESTHQADFLAFVDQRIALGYTQAEVLEALDVTTMTTGDAGQVMENLHQGKGIPEDMRGVWTVRDDAALNSEDRSEFERIRSKHGMRRIVQRRKFREDQREAKRLLDESSNHGKCLEA